VGWSFSTPAHFLGHWSQAARRGHWWPWVVGALLLAATSAPASAAAPLGLRVEVDPAIDDAALLPRWIADRHPLLAPASHEPEGAQVEWVAVQIAGSTYDYRVSITAMRARERLGDSTEPVRCECTTEELLALVDEGIARERERLRPPPPREPVAETIVARPEPEPPAPSLEHATLAAPRRGRLGALGRAGLGVSAMGAGMAIAGVSLGLRPNEIRGEPGSLEFVSTKSVGIGLSASGGVVLGTGLALLIIDLARSAHRPPGPRAVAIAPLGGPQRLGLSLTRRF
jgi:hypothetical protein